MEIERTCLDCKWFVSFQEDYQDPLEPHDFGFCWCEESKYYGNEGAGVDVVCKWIKKNETTK